MYHNPDTGIEKYKNFWSAGTKGYTRFLGVVVGPVIRAERDKNVCPPPPHIHVYCMLPTVTIIVIKDNPWSSASFFLNAWLHLQRLTFFCEAQFDHVKINSGKLKLFVHNIIHGESISFFLHFSLRDMRDVGVVPSPQSKKHQNKRKGWPSNDRMHMVREIKTEGDNCLQQLLMIMIYIKTHLRVLG